MKIKEVVRRTGLTEKTIRYYENKGLVVPESTEQNGRQFRSYTEENVLMLQAVATLRRARFRIEQIAQIQQDPSCIPQLLSRYEQAVEESYEAMGRILALLREGKLQGAGDLYALAEQLRQPMEGVPLPKQDVKFQFRRLDQLEAERRAEVQATPASRFRFGWMTIYVGGDEQRFIRVREAMQAAGLSYRVETYTYGNRMIQQQMTNQASSFNTSRAPTPTPYGLQAKMLKDKNMDRYAVLVRRRDEEKARRALREFG